MDKKQINEWESGAQFEVTIKNTTELTLDEVLIRMHLPPSMLNSVWDMNIVNKGSNYVDLGLPQWKQTLPPGERYTFGFVLNQVELPQFTDLTASLYEVIDQEDVPTEEVDDPTTEAEDETVQQDEGSLEQILSPELKLVIHEDSFWVSGGSYTAALINTGSQIITSVKLKTNEGPGLRPWAINIISQTSNNTIMLSPNWAIIPPGGSYRFGWNIATPNGQRHIPVLRVIDISY